MTTTTDLLRRYANGLLKFPADTRDMLLAECAGFLKALADQMERAGMVALTAFQKSAPERVWINVFGTEDDYPDGFPSNHEDITWAENGVGDLDIPYVRADLAHPAPEVTRDAEPVAWRTEDFDTDKSATTYDPDVRDRWIAKGWPVEPLYTNPAPEMTRDAERYRWLRKHCAYRGTDITFGRGFNQTVPEGLDAALDAAMQEPKP